jgi:acetolactate synthase-1/2/3 large subunit
MDPEQGFAPKVIAEKRPDGTIVSKPLEDMFPWLDPEELRDNMLVDVYRREPREDK